MITIRPLSMDDVPALASIRLAAKEADHFDMPFTEGDVRSELLMPGFDLAHDAFVACGPEGRPLGFATTLFFSGPEDTLWVRLVVHPDAWQTEANSRLWQAISARVDERAAQNAGRVTWLHTQVPVGCWHASQMPGDLRLSRYEFKMVCDLGKTGVPEGAVPPGIDLRLHRRPQDDAPANAMLNEAFHDHWGTVDFSDDQFAHMLDSEFQADASVVAWDGDVIAGGCYNDLSEQRCQRLGRREGYVDMLAVRRPWRKRGLATALLAWTLRKAAARKFDSVALHVDAENLTGARRLYQRVGFCEVEQHASYRKQVAGPMVEENKS